ncbi:MAG: hypothetical protein ACI9BC_002001 [Crocinitomicaceae bacterium]
MSGIVAQHPAERFYSLGMNPIAGFHLWHRVNRHHNTRRLQGSSRPGFGATMVDYLSASKALAIIVPHALGEALARY